MATTKFKGTEVKVAGDLPAVGSKAPDFSLVSAKLQEVKLSDFAGKKVILNIFPSVDTGICALSTKTFNEKAAGLENTVVVCVSKDLPFAFGRFCGAEGIVNVETLSEFKNQNFSCDYGVLLEESPLAGLMARAVVVLNEAHEVVYTELVPEITQEPDYESALKAL